MGPVIDVADTSNEELVPYFPNGIILGTGEGQDDVVVVPDPDLEDDVAAGDQVILDGRSGTVENDGVAPATPTGLTAVGGVRALFIKWNANAEADMSNGYGEYDIQIDDTDNTFASLVVNNSTSRHSFVADGLLTGTTYFIRVRARDAFGDESGWTTDVSAAPVEVDTEDLAAGSITAEKLTALELEVGQYIQSFGYDPGVDGWRIDSDGTAEFEDVTARGHFETAATGQRVEMNNDSIYFYSPAVDEVLPAQIVTSSAGDDHGRVDIRSPEFINGYSQMLLDMSDVGGGHVTFLADTMRFFGIADVTKTLLEYPPQGGRIRRSSGYSHGTSGSTLTAPVTGGSTVSGGIGTWDGTNACWLPPQEWFDWFGTVWLSIHWRVTFDPSGTGTREVRFRTIDDFGAGVAVGNQPAWEGPAAGALVPHTVSGTCDIEVVVEEAVQMRLFQSSGGALNINYYWSPTFAGGTD